MPIKIGLTEIDDSVSDKYPGLKEYTLCQSKAFVHGILGVCLGASAGFSGSIYYRRKFPLASKHLSVILPIVCGVATGYFISSVSTQSCQHLWVEIANEKLTPPNIEEIEAKKKYYELKNALKPGSTITVQKNKYGNTIE